MNIFNVFGYEKTDNIIIPSFFKAPGGKKLKRKEEFYEKTGVLPEIFIDENNILVDGYCSYIIAKKLRIKQVKVRRIKGE